MNVALFLECKKVAHLKLATNRLVSCRSKLASCLRQQNISLPTWHHVAVVLFADELNVSQSVISRQQPLCYLSSIVVVPSTTFQTSALAFLPQHNIPNSRVRNNMIFLRPSSCTFISVHPLSQKLIYQSRSPALVQLLFQTGLSLSKLCVHEVEELLPSSFTRMVLVGTVQCHLDALSGNNTPPHMRVIGAVGITIAVHLHVSSACKPCQQTVNMHLSVTFALECQKKSA